MTGRLARGVWLIIGAALLVLPALPVPAWSGAPDRGPLWPPYAASWGIGLVVVLVSGILAGRLATRLAPARIPWPQLRPFPAVAALSIGLMLLAVWVMQWVFASNPQLVDEIAQLFHARAFAGGRLAAPAPQPPEAFLVTHTWIIDTKTGRPYPERSQRHQPTGDEDVQWLAGQGIIAVILNHFVSLCANLPCAIL